MEEPKRSMSKSTKEGYLIKEGWKVKNWKKRWFVLGKETLSYYRSQKSLKKVLGVVALNEISSVSPVAAKRKNGYTLQIVTPRRTYFVVADTLKLCEEWQEAIKTQVENTKRAKNQLNSNSNSNLADDPELDEKVTVDSFEFLTIIGQGSFGKVVQVRHKNTGDIFAMKILNKKNIVDRGEVEHTKAERNILLRINHPFLMKLHYSFQTKDKLYLVMDFINGGELFYHLQNERKFGNDRARFYAAEIVLAMEHLHLNSIMYRDLKPENLLLDSSGHIRMTDFGLSKENVSPSSRTHTFCGTPEYLAPEVLDGQEYGNAVDWWSLGTLIYEMLTGLPPFYDEDVQKMYNRKMSSDLEIPDYVDDKAKDLIRKFLDRSPAVRLADPEKIKSHPWFRGLDWDKLYRKELIPPYVPSVTKESTKMIDRQFTTMNIKELGKEGEVLEGDEFMGFTYQPGKEKKNNNEDNNGKDEKKDSSSDEEESQ